MNWVPSRRYSVCELYLEDWNSLRTARRLHVLQHMEAMCVFACVYLQLLSWDHTATEQHSVNTCKFVSYWALCCWLHRFYRSANSSTIKRWILDTLARAPSAWKLRIVWNTFTVCRLLLVHCYYCCCVLQVRRFCFSSLVLCSCCSVCRWNTLFSAAIWAIRIVCVCFFTQIYTLWTVSLILDTVVHIYNLLVCLLFCIVFFFFDFSCCRCCYYCCLGSSIVVRPHNWFERLLLAEIVTHKSERRVDVAHTFYVYLCH